MDGEVRVGWSSGGRLEESGWSGGWTVGLLVVQRGAQLTSCSGGCDASRARIGGLGWSCADCNSR